MQVIPTVPIMTSARKPFRMISGSERANEREEDIFQTSSCSPRTIDRSYLPYISSQKPTAFLRGANGPIAIGSVHAVNSMHIQRQAAIVEQRHQEGKD